MKVAHSYQLESSCPTLDMFCIIRSAYTKNLLILMLIFNSMQHFSEGKWVPVYFGSSWI